ncbi:hypothetical protein LCGC14_2453740, partial [marine sediment metagenome]
PKWLSVAAKTVWKQITPQLDKAGILAKLDGNTLVRYCETYAHWRKLMKILGDAEITNTDHVGQLRGVFLTVEALGSSLNRLEADFGLSPSSRSRIQVQPTKAEEDDGKDRFFKAG